MAVVEFEEVGQGLATRTSSLKRCTDSRLKPLRWNGGGDGDLTGVKSVEISLPAQRNHPGPSLRPAKPLLEKLELLVDRLLGRFHLDEAVDEALTVGLDPLFKVGDLGVNFARLLG